MITLGAYFFIISAKNDIAESISWLPLASLVVFFVSIGIGLGPLVWLITSEVLPPKLRGLGGSIAAFTNFLSAFVVTKTFVDLQRSLTVAGTFWFYAVVCLFGALFAWFLLPETKGKTSDEIEALFAKPEVRSQGED